MRALGIAVVIDGHLEENLDWAKGAGFSNCQLQLWDMDCLTEEHAKRTRAAADRYGLEITGLWCGWHGPIKWDFAEGPSILGIVPPQYRASRTQNLLDGSAYARALGVETVITHLGFVPTDCRSESYTGVVSTLRYITSVLQERGQMLLMETGQEPPIVLKRLIDDVGAENLFVNYDPANLMMYGNANPVDGLDILGRYVKSVHAKDGSYPVNGYELGTEYPIGKGKVDFTGLLEKLKALDYDGPISIEYEIEAGNERQRQEILEGKAYLERLLA